MKFEKDRISERERKKEGEVLQTCKKGTCGLRPEVPFNTEKIDNSNSTTVKPVLSGHSKIDKAKDL